MAFWGAVVKPGKPHAFVPPPEEWNLHLSQAAIAPTLPEGQRVALAVTTDPKDEPIIVCTLTAGRSDTAVLDLFFSQYTEFSVLGSHDVHLTGYYTPSQVVDDDDEEGEDDDDEEYEPGALGFPIHAGDEDDEDEDEDEEEDDDLEGVGEDEDEDDDSIDMEGEDEEMFGYNAMLRGKRKPHVIIEDITDVRPEEATDADGVTAGKKTGAKATVADGKKAAQQRVAAAQAENGKKSAKKQVEEEDEEEDEEEEEEEEEEDESEEEAPQDNRTGKGGNKRPVAANGGAKAAGPASKKQAVGQQQQPQAQPVAVAKKGQQQQPDGRPKQDIKQQEPKQPKQQQQQVEAKQAPAEKNQDTKAGKKNIRRHPNGFEIEDVTYGNPKGKVAKPGQKVMVRYAGRLKANGKEFDSSGKKPFQFRLGVGEVIKGWDLGVEGMRVGDKRRLVIPPQLAYGAAGVKGTIPSNATLEFDVELVDVK